MARLTLLLSLTMVLLAAPPARAAPWQWPIEGPLLRSFALGSDPYARGWHRGVDLGAPPGAMVRSACAGRVSFAGRVPGGGRTVSVRCGTLVATYQRLGAISVRAGLWLARGAPLGVGGGARRSHVHLGAREARSGRYVDPLTLLRGGGDPLAPLVPGAPGWRRTAPPLGVPGAVRARVPRALPLGAAPRGAVARPAFAGGAAPRIAPGGASRGTGPPPGAPYDPAAPLRGLPLPPVPWLVWAGLACVALALPVGGLFALRRQRRVAARLAAAPAHRP